MYSERGLADVEGIGGVGDNDFFAAWVEKVSV